MAVNHLLLHAVPWPNSCQRESDTDPYRVPYAKNAGIIHQVPHERYASQPLTPSSASQMMVSRTAGPLRRFISAFMVSRGTSHRYQSADTNPASLAR